MSMLEKFGVFYILGSNLANVSQARSSVIMKSLFVKLETAFEVEGIITMGLCWLLKKSNPHFLRYSVNYPTSTVND